jgi:hypothetical protein
MTVPRAQFRWVPSGFCYRNAPRAMTMVGYQHFQRFAVQMHLSTMARALKSIEISAKSAALAQNVRTEICGGNHRNPGPAQTTASLLTPNGGRIAAAGGPPRPFATGSVSVAGPAQVLAPTHTNTFARTRLEWLGQQEFPMFMSFHMQQGVPERDARMMWDAYEHRCMSA